MTLSTLRTSLSTAALAAGLALSPAGLVAQEAGTAAALPQDFTAIVEEMSPAVVGILATHGGPGQDAMPGMPGGPRIPGMPDMPFGGPGQGPGPMPGPRGGVALGSGFVVDGEGHVVTNNHVVEGASEVEVRLSDGSTRAAEIVGTDPATDLAVLRLEDAGGMTTTEWGDSDAIRPGAWTIAIGSPFGLGGTVTVGVLSAASRDINAGPYDDFLQTDASINSGNSGGPLFNAAGEVIGVNTAIFSPVGANVGIGFAVPSNVAQDVVRQLIDTGEVRRGFIGVSMQALTEPLARALGLDDAAGALVAAVEPGGPAAQAGIREGDVILEVNGSAVEDPRALSRAVAGIVPGETAEFTLFRDGERTTIEVDTVQRELEQAAAEAGAADGMQLGVAVAPLTEMARQSLGIEEDAGLVVQQVAPGSPAAEAGLMAGDVIVSAAGEAIADVEALGTAWSAAREAERPMLLKVNRSGRALFLAVEPVAA